MIHMIRYDLDRCALHQDMLLISWCRSYTGSMLHMFFQESSSLYRPQWPKVSTRSSERSMTCLSERGAEIAEESNFPRSVCSTLSWRTSCWQAKTSSCGHAGWSLKSGGCSDCAFPFFLWNRPFLMRSWIWRWHSHLKYKAMLAIHSVDWFSFARWRLCRSDSVRTCLFGSCRRIRLQESIPFQCMITSWCASWSNGWKCRLLVFLA